MFQHNVYFEEYMKIIFVALTLNRTKGNEAYYEAHHIIPRKIEPRLEFDKMNLVLLTASEHYKCHILLPFFTVGQARDSMLHAWNWMSNQIQRDKTILSPEEYTTLREEYSKAASRRQTGRKPTAETRKKMSVSAMGHGVTQETRNKISKGNTGKVRSQEFKDKLGTPEIRAKISATKTGQKYSAEHKKAISDSLVGRELSQKHKDAIGEGNKGPQKIITCPHCGKTGGNAMLRWHFDNCKQKEK